VKKLIRILPIKQWRLDVVKTLSLSSKLALILIAIVVSSTATLSAVAYWHMRNEVLQQLQYDIDKTIDSQSALASLWLDSRKKIVASSVGVAMDDNPKPGMSRARAAGGFGLFFTAYADKRTVYFDNTQAPQGYDPTVRPWYQLAAAAGGVVASKPYMSVVDKSLVVTIAAPVIRDGKLLGVMGGNMGLDLISRQLLSVKQAGDGFAMLLHKDGTILAYPQSAALLKPIDSVIPELNPARIEAMAQEHDLREVQVNGERRFLVLRHIAGTDWYFGLAIDRAAVLSPLNSLLVFLAVALLVIVLLCVALAIASTRKMLAGLVGLHDAMENIAAGEGDLTQRLDVHSQDEVGASAQAMNRFLGQIQSMFTEVRRGSDSVTRDVHHLAQATSRIATDADLQAEELSATAATIEQITVSITHIADAIREAEKLTVNADQASGASAGIIGQVSVEIGSIAETVNGLASHMNELDTRTEQIADIIAVIKGIADQTNLLALNAAIEAARAGEQGRGFAVVADEVRKLAERTGMATVEIGGMIDGMRAGMQQALSKMSDTQRIVDNGVERSSQAVTGIQLVRQGLNDIAERVSSIASSTSEQTQAATALAQSTEQVNNRIQANTGAIRDTDRTLQDLKERATQLGGLVSRFRL